MTPERIAEICNQAADLLETDGWCRFAAQRNGHHCLVGALNEVLGGYTEFEPDVMDAIIATADPRIEPTRIATLSSWNDRQASKRPVIRLLRRTARQVVAP